LGLFKKQKPSIGLNFEQSRDANIQAMIITASHICDGMIKSPDPMQALDDQVWKDIWSALLFGGLRYLSTEESIEFLYRLLDSSEIDLRLKTINADIKNKPDEELFYELPPARIELMKTIDKQIYDLAFEEALHDLSKLDRNRIFNEVFPMVEHYVYQHVKEVQKYHQAFASIVASSIALAAEEIISQEPRYGLEATKNRYGACQVVFALAIVLFISREFERIA